METILGEAGSSGRRGQGERETQERGQTPAGPSQSLQPARQPPEGAQPAPPEADTSVPAQPCLAGPGHHEGLEHYAAMKKRQ